MYLAQAGAEAAPSVFSGSTGAVNALTGSSSAAGNTANQIATQNNSWVQAVTGALGGIAGAAVGDFSFGGSSGQADANQVHAYQSDGNGF